MKIQKFFSPELYRVELEVEESEHGQRLDHFVALFLKTVSRQKIQQKIRDQEITIAKKKAKASTKVTEKDAITLLFYKREAEDDYWQKEKIKAQNHCPIVFEDDNILIVSKPPFMSTHPTGKHVFNCVTVCLEGQYNFNLRTVHRLDRETSGVLVLGKNQKGAHAMASQFEHGEVKKVYFLIAKGEAKLPITAKERMENQEDQDRLQVELFPETSSQGKSAETSFEAIYQEGPYTLALAFPKTGRQHQIRAHAWAHGFPLLGDKIYGAESDLFGRMKDRKALPQDYQHLEIPRHALHALALKISVNDRPQVFRDAIPSDLGSWIESHLSIDLADLSQKIEHLLKLKL